jgi:uncharacterized protein (DUF983 family)
METDNNCPKCGEDIGIWAVFKATLPNRIYCPHCGARLEYGGTWGLIIFAIVASVFLLAFAALVWVNVEDQISAWVASGAIFLLGGALLELGLVLRLWYGDYRLQQVGKPRPAEETDW